MKENYSNLYLDKINLEKKLKNNQKELTESLECQMVLSKALLLLDLAFSIMIYVLCFCDFSPHIHTAIIFSNSEMISSVSITAIILASSVIYGAGLFEINDLKKEIENCEEDIKLIEKQIEDNHKKEYVKNNSSEIKNNVEINSNEEKIEELKKIKDNLVSKEEKVKIYVKK